MKSAIQILPARLELPNGFAILVGELKWRHRAVVLDLSAGQTLNFDVT